MRINSSYIGMESERKYEATSSRTLKFGVYVKKGQLGGNKESLTNQKDQEELKKGENTKKLNPFGLPNNFSKIRGVRPSVEESAQESFSKIRESCIRHLLDYILGMNRGGKNRSVTGETDPQTVERKEAEVELLEYVKEEEYYFKETEKTSFSAAGKVVTADGREIDFAINLEMSRSFEAYYKTQEKRMDLKFIDPLVINLDTNIAEIADQKFFFDLDADGTEEEISQLQAGSGYLALDKNGDGKINDGNELFGTKSGNGFADLAEYDTDKDGWIDEDDEIFDKLQIWCKDQNGKDVLYRLKDKGVGAICLQNTRSDFALNNKENKTNAMIRSTGIFLYENGTSGTVQHLDMVR